MKVLIRLYMHSYKAGFLYKEARWKLKSVNSIHTVWIASLNGLQAENCAFFFICSGKLLQGSSAQGEIINYLGGCRRHLKGAARWTRAALVGIVRTAEWSSKGSFHCSATMSERLGKRVPPVQWQTNLKLIRYPFAWLIECMPYIPAFTYTPSFLSWRVELLGDSLVTCKSRGWGKHQIGTGETSV